MLDGEQFADFSRRAAIVRKIAKGIYDKEERRMVLEFVADAEKLAAKLATKH